MKTKIKWGWSLQPIPRAIKEEARLVKRNFEKYLEKQGKSGILFLYLQGDLLAKIRLGNPSEYFRNLNGECYPIIIEIEDTIVCIVSNFDFDASLLKVLSPEAHPSTVSCRVCGAKEGELHKYGCPEEICHWCGKRLMSIKHSCCFQKDLPSDDFFFTPEGGLPHTKIRLRVGEDVIKRSKFPPILRYLETRKKSR